MWWLYSLFWSSICLLCKVLGSHIFILYLTLPNTHNNWWSCLSSPLTILVSYDIIFMATVDKCLSFISDIFMKIWSILSFGVCMRNNDEIDEFSPMTSPCEGKSRRGDEYHLYWSPLIDLPSLSVRYLVNLSWEGGEKLIREWSNSSLPSTTLSIPPSFDWIASVRWMSTLTMCCWRLESIPVKKLRW